MAAIAGSAESISLSGREFPVTADADVSRKLGGFMNTRLQNGNGTDRKLQVREAWSLSGVIIECDDSRGDHEFVQELADGVEDFACTITYANGETYQGTGSITSEVTQRNQAATIAFDLSGAGKLTKQ